MRRVGFEFQINYHSAAELLLYGTGWQVATPTPDDLLYEAIAGDDANPAIAGLRPRHLRRALHHQRRDHRARPQRRTARWPSRPRWPPARPIAPDPDDEWDPEDCQSGFNFPDYEELIQAEFEKNIPFALATARSARSRRPGVGRRDDGARLPGGQLRRVLRRPAARRRRPGRSATSGSTTRSTAGGPIDATSASGTAVSATAARPTSTTPSSGPGPTGASPATRSRCGSPARTPTRPPVQSEHFTYTVASDTAPRC